MADVLRYGDTIRLINGYANFNGGYLDGCERRELPPDARLGVQTAVSPNRDNGSGSWRVESAGGKPTGAEVLSCDPVHLFNLHRDDGGYLAVFGQAAPPELYLVGTTPQVGGPLGEPQTWHLFADAAVEDDGKIRIGEAVRLLNGRNHGQGGFLDSCGSRSRPGSLYGVYTSRLSDRGVRLGAHHCTGLWRIVRAGQPVPCASP
ncbi:hypothetical protein [Chromobacterium sp. CV08]|uniref:hypothetical protein n=1 Tax=Chromobacterium sp. CV08 TaxID=3133274 RepID=UPI003DA899B8